jgi:hypothetical protein
LLQSLPGGKTGGCRWASGAPSGHQGAGVESSAGREGVSLQPESTDLEPPGGAHPGEQSVAGPSPLCPASHLCSNTESAIWLLSQRCDCTCQFMRERRCSRVRLDLFKLKGVEDHLPQLTVNLFTEASYVTHVWCQPIGTKHWHLQLAKFSTAYQPVCCEYSTSSIPSPS